MMVSGQQEKLRAQHALPLDPLPPLVHAEPEGRQSPLTRFARRAFAADALMLALAALVLYIASPTASPTGAVPRMPLEWVAVMSLLTLAVFYLRGMYAPPMRPDLIESWRYVVAGTAIAVSTGMALRVLVTDDAYVAAETARYWFVTLPLLGIGRHALLTREARARRQRQVSRRTVIVGGGEVGMLTAQRLLAHPELGLEPVAFLDEDPVDADRAPPSLPILSHHGDFEAFARRLAVDHVIIAFSRATDHELSTLARECWRLGITVSVVPRLFEVQGQHVATEHIGGLPLMELRAADPQGWQFRVKYALDRVVAALLLVAFSPLMLAISAAIAVTMGRPILYRQTRVGRDGHAFDILKFRTMREANGEADADWAAQQLGDIVRVDFADPEDRLTPLGRFLRRASFDELPQLWNVLRGDMSMIGPRPERASYVPEFEKGIYRYGDRHRVKSGVTGWAQVHGLRGKTSLQDRIEWDNHYIENWSLWLDLKIALKTVGALARPQSE